MGGLGVEGLGLQVQGLGFEVSGSGFGVTGIVDKLIPAQSLICWRLARNGQITPKAPHICKPGIAFVTYNL